LYDFNTASGQLRLRLWLSDAPTTRLDLTHKKENCPQTTAIGECFLSQN
jgi:hypothetical protein